MLVVVAAALVGTGAVAAQNRHHGAQPVVVGAALTHPLDPVERVVNGVLEANAHRRRVERRREQAARRQPHTKARATISLYERSVRRSALRRQGCSAAKRGVGGIVILDFGQPAYNGHTYGTYLFSGRFAGNKSITRAMFAYAYGYHRCLARRSRLRITLARGTSNYHPQVPSAYKAGRKWARETMALQHSLRLHGLHEHVLSAAADDVEPAWDRSFHRTRDFFRGYRDAHTGHTIYNHAMARQWAELAHIARHRYHRPMRFAGVMTTHTSRNHGMKPRDAHKTLVRALATRMPAATPDVPPTLTNIVAAD